MEGMSVVKEIMGFVNEYGMVPMLILAGVVFYFMNKDTKRSFSKIEGAIDSVKSGSKETIGKLEKSIQAVKEQTDKADEHIHTTIEKKFNLVSEQLAWVGKEIDHISSSYVTKEQHYKDLEGWKTEINCLRKETMALPFKMMELMVQRGKGENEA